MGDKKQSVGNCDNPKIIRRPTEGAAQAFARLFRLLDRWDREARSDDDRPRES